MWLIVYKKKVTIYSRDYFCEKFFFLNNVTLKFNFLMPFSCILFFMCAFKALEKDAYDKFSHQSIMQDNFMKKVAIC